MGVSGGMFARSLGREMPDHVRQVITLGSPFRGEGPVSSHASGPFVWLRHLHVPPSELPPAESDRLPLKVPLTAVYTKGDGIVTWRSCLQADGEARENIEVVGSHCGLGHNPAAMWVVADRLALPEGAWTPFVRPSLASGLYPTPSYAAAPA